jgi:hypothetical protein
MEVLVNMILFIKIVYSALVVCLTLKVSKVNPQRVLNPLRVSDGGKNQYQYEGQTCGCIYQQGRVQTPRFAPTSGLLFEGGMSRYVIIKLLLL